MSENKKKKEKVEFWISNKGKVVSSFTPKKIPPGYMVMDGPYGEIFVNPVKCDKCNSKKLVFSPKEMIARCEKCGSKQKMYADSEYFVWWFISY